MLTFVQLRNRRAGAVLSVAAGPWASEAPSPVIVVCLNSMSMGYQEMGSEGTSRILDTI